MIGGTDTSGDDGQVSGPVTQGTMIAIYRWCFAVVQCHLSPLRGCASLRMTSR